MTPERTHGKSLEEHGKIVRDGYGKIAREYYQDRDAFGNEREIAEFLAFLPDGGVVLDIGCGASIPILRMLLDNEFIAKGIDFSKGMLELAKKNVHEGELIHGDVTKTDFEERSLDGVLSTYAIIHIH